MKHKVDKEAPYVNGERYQEILDDYQFLQEHTDTSNQNIVQARLIAFQRLESKTGLTFRKKSDFHSKMNKFFKEHGIVVKNG